MDQRFGPYQVGETIGRGTFAKVKVAVHEATKTKVALKVIPRKVMEEDPKSEVKIKREIRILQILRHPHVMRLYDVVQTKHDIILVLEYVSGGELFDYISRRGRLHESLARLFFQQLIAAVGYCHAFNVAHRDLKPENILLEQNMKSIKIGDFGLSSIIRDGKLFETSCGTPNYAAPEVVSGRLYNGREADVWSCGVVLFTMLAGGLPFDDPYVNVLFKKIQSASYQMPSFVPKGAQDIIAKMLVPDPLERATIEQIMQHPWVRESFPAHLIVIHTEALYAASRFCQAARRALISHLDQEVVAYVAARFRMLPQRVMAILSRKENGGLGDACEPPTPSDGTNVPSIPEEKQVRPAQCFVDTFSSVADDKVKPEPLVIPLAEEKLRDEDHDVFVAYYILLDRKLMRRQAIDGTPPNNSGNSRHTDPMGGIGSSNATINSSGNGSGKGSEGGQSGFASSSLTASRFGATLPQQQQGSHVQALMSTSVNATMEYGSLRGLSLGPHSHKPAPSASHSAPGHLQRAPDGTMHFSPLFVAPAPPGPFVDVFLAGYNALAQPRLELYQPGSKSSALGMLFGVPEVHYSEPSCGQSSQPSRTSLLMPEGPKPVAPQQREPLLKPQPLLQPIRSNSGSISSDDDGSRGSSVDSRHAQHNKNNNKSSPAPLQPPAASATSTAVHGISKFGGDFMRNGVMFRRSDAQSVFHVLCEVLKSCGLRWKDLQPFAVVAVRQPSAKVMCKVYKVDQEDYVVDVRVSVQSGVSGLDCATEILEKLLAKATSK